MTWLKPGLVALALLSACATPEQRCVATASKELRTLDALIAETELNLSRGYRVEIDVDYIPRLTFCTGFGNGYDDRYIYGGVRFCQGVRRVERERQVAIDPLAERRTLANLERRRAEIEGPTRTALAICRETR